MSLKVANRALQLVHADRIASFTSSEGQDAKEALDIALKWTLRRVAWTEESTAVCPDEMAVCDPCCDLPNGYCYAFHLPKDYIRAASVCPKACDPKCPPPEMQWKIAKVKDARGDHCHALITDCKPVKLEYVCLPKNAEALHEDVQEVVAYKMAMELAMFKPIDKSLSEMLERRLEAALKDARDVSEHHDHEDIFAVDGELVDARLCGWW